MGDDDDDDDDGMTNETRTAAAFTRIQDDFLTTLDRTDKLLKRQIYALEEAGIITLRNTNNNTNNNNNNNNAAALGGSGLDAQPAQQPQPSDGSAVRLRPDGVGKYGKLDVGMLNMASSTVERDMDSELRRRARDHLDLILARGPADSRMRE